MASWLSDPETRQAARAAGFRDVPVATAVETLKPIQQYLPMSVIPNAAGSHGETGDLGNIAYCSVAAWIPTDRGAMWLLDYEYDVSGTVRDDDGYSRNVTTTYSGTIAALLDPRVDGEVDIRKDWKSGVGGALLNAFLWVPPFTIVKAFQYAWAPKDLEVGQGDFDERFVVESSSQEAAQKAVHPALGQCLLDIDFKERLRIRPGVALVRLPDKRPKGREGFAVMNARLERIVRAILSGAEALPYR